MVENSSTAPIWFDVEQLKDAQFGAENYVAELRRYVPLDSITSQLETYLSQLKLELVEVINAKYNDFVGLTGQLSGVEGAVTRIKKPLLNLSVKLEVVERGLDSELQLLSLSLDHRQRLVNARRQLEMMQNAYQISMKIEKLIQEVHGSRHEGLPMQSSLLERVSQEVGRLDLLLSEETQLELIKQLKKQNQEFRQKVQDQLKTVLENGLRSQNPDHRSVIRILSALNVLGAPQAGEEIIKNELIIPQFTALQQQRDLRLFFEQFLEQSFQVYLGILPVLVKSPPGLENYCFLGNSVVSAVHEEIRKHRSFVYSPGNPDSFLQNYSSVLYFLQQLEIYCPSKGSLEQFRSNPSVKEFQKQWNLQVYFAMRFQEIAGYLDAVLVVEKHQMKPKTSVEVVETWIKCLRLCFDPNIFTPQLSDQFVKLFFKLLSRFENWIKQNIISLKEKDEIAFQSFPKSNEDLALLEKDLLLPKETLQDDFYLRSLPVDCKAALQTVVDLFLERLETLRQDVLQIISGRLISDCAAIVKKSVGTAVSTMFGTSSERPTQPNDYVKRLLDPLKLFLNSTALREEIKTQIKVSVVRGICSEYRQALINILSFWEKSRMSLMRINKSRLATTDTSQSDSSSSNPTELSNVYQQHWLDVSAFGQILQELHLPQLEEYTELKDLIISKKEEV